MSISYYDCIAHHAMRQPQSLAAVDLATGRRHTYRAFNERSGNRFGAGVQGRPPMPNAENAHLASYIPVGLLTPASWVAIQMPPLWSMCSALLQQLQCPQRQQIRVAGAGADQVDLTAWPLRAVGSRAQFTVQQRLGLGSMGRNR